MGLPVMPADIDPATDAVNQNLLLSLLNEGNAFDKPLYPVNKDRLQISFTTPDGGLLSYGFIYKKGAWQACEFDYFNWFTEHDEIKEGKIKNAFSYTGASVPYPNH